MTNTGNYRSLRVEVQGIEHVRGIDGLRQECLGVVFTDVEAGNHVNVCYAPNTFEPVRGGFFVGDQGIELTVEYSVAAYSLTLDSKFGIALSLMGKPWSVNQEWNSSWFGVPVQWRIVEATKDQVAALGRFETYDPYGTEASSQSIFVRFNRDQNAPVAIGFKERDLNGFDFVGAYKQGSGLMLPSTGPDWGRLIGELVPHEFPWPAGSGCQPFDITPKEAFDFALSKDPNLASMRDGFVQRVTYISPEPSTALLREARLRMYLTKDGKQDSLEVTKQTTGLGPPVLSSTYAPFSSDRLDIDAYPPTVLPFCTGLSKLRSILGPDAQMTIDAQASLLDGIIEVDRSLLPNSTWGASSVAILMKGAGNSKECWLGGISNLLVQCAS